MSDDGVMVFLEWREAFLRTRHLNKYLKKLRNEKCMECMEEKEVQ